MSRGFDGFEIDDFRDSGFDSGRDVSRSSSTDWKATRDLDKIHRAEDRADTLDRKEQQRPRGERPPLPREEVAKRYHLKVVSGEIPIPDLRVEYLCENDAGIQRRDLELAADHYRPRGLAQKARAGFQIYARRGDTDRLRRIRDDHQLSTTILSL